ncbi:MAG: hypothetical protein HY447_01100 [Candidatus Omnitrophica bacterium]|nr:hypothetical protein [Candidatus Omnitrophota bacterium]
MKHIFLILALFCSLIGTVRDSRADFYGTPPTGLLALESKHPYYLFVPPSYTAEKSWPAFLILGERGQDPKEVISPWVDWAKQNQVFILALPNLVAERDVPDSVNQWLFEVQQEVAERYEIDSAQVLLVGIGSGAHYSAYLGLKYPERFSAVVLIGSAWEGPYEKLMKSSSNQSEQISFFLALDPNGADFSRDEAKAIKLQEKGYRITLENLTAGQELSALRDRIIQWFREDKELRMGEETPKKTWKEKVGKFAHDFVEV